MNTAIAIGCGIVAIGIIGYAIARLFQKSDKNVISADKIEHIEKINMSDIVNYFKSKPLNPDEDKPFVCQNLDKIGVNFPEGTKLDGTLLVLGVMNSKTDKIEDFRILCVKNPADDVKAMLGNDPLVVLA